VRVQIARSAAEMERLRSVWEALYAATPAATFFQDFAWNHLAALHFGARESPLVVLVESDGGAALIPAALTGQSLTFLGECLFDYRTVLVAGDTAILQRGWEELARLRLPLDIVALRGIENRDLLGPLAPHPFCNAPAVRCADLTAEQFAARHGRLGRYWRRLQRRGAHLVRYDGRSGDLLRWLYRRKAAQFEGRDNNIFRDESRIDFLVAAAAVQPHQCEIFTLECERQVIAGLVTFLDGPVRRFYTIYFDPAWARDSPGTVLIYEVTRRSLAAGLDCDYMTGEQPHKLRFASFMVPLFRVHATADDLARAAGPPLPVAPAAA
jgi:CelD/BcsL family acetyltransferase involved in cellulose biosynthesis